MRRKRNPSNAETIKKIFLSVIIFALIFFADLAYSQQEKLLEIQIQSGDTLYKFAERYLDNPDRWPELLEYNRLSSGNPNLILPGDVLLVPVELVKDQIADISYIKNNVRMRRKEAPLWKEAGLNERMYSEDGIRTAKKSFAQIKYLKGAIADIYENSLVFLRAEKKRDEILKLVIGELTAKDVKVLTDSAVIDPEKKSVYIANVDKYKTTKVSVLKGRVAFISSGKKVIIDEGFMSVAKLNQPPAVPVKIPDLQNLKEIQQGKLKSYKIFVKLPELQIKYPRDGEKIKGKIAVIRGKTEKEAMITVNGNQINIEDDGTFIAAVTLEEGSNQIIIKASRSQGHTTVRTINVEKIAKRSESILPKMGIISAILGITVMVISVVM